MRQPRARRLASAVVRTVRTTIAGIFATICALSSCDSSRHAKDLNRTLAVLHKRYVVDSIGEFGVLVDADWLTDSTIVLVAESGTSIRVVDASGVARQIARNGDGPGEVRGVRNVIRVGADQFIAIDGASSRASYWTIEGNLLHDVRLRGSYISGAWSTDSGVIVRTHDEGRSAIELVHLDASTDSQPIVRRLPFSGNRSESPCQYCKIALGRDLSVVSHIMDDSAYRLLRFTSAGQPKPPLVREGVPLVARSKTELDSIAQFRTRFISQRESAVERRAFKEAFDQLPISPMKYRFMGAVIVDRELNIWIQRQTASGAPVEVDVFDRGGTFEFTVLLPEGSRLVRSQGGRILVFRNSENGDQSVEEYRVRR